MVELGIARQYTGKSHEASQDAAQRAARAVETGELVTPATNGPSADIGDDDQSGRGLLIVGNLARAWGITGDETGRVVWAELDCQ